MLRRLMNVRVLIGVMIIALVVVVGYLWYRGSSLVKIKQVTVTGLSGPDVAQIRSALTQEALTMTTMNASTAKLEQAVSGYPEVSSLSFTTQGSHAITIDVVEKIPVAKLGSELIDGGGYVLSHDAIAKEALPQLKAVGVSATYATTDGQVTGVKNLAVLKVLGAAPYRFLPHVKYGTFTGADGIVLQLKNGPQLYFGAATQVGEKWTAVLDALTSTDTAGACYINVSDPQRPASGVNNQRYCTDGSTTSSSSSYGTSTSTQTTPETTTPATTTPLETTTAPTTTAVQSTTTSQTSTSG